MNSFRTLAVLMLAVAASATHANAATFILNGLGSTAFDEIASNSINFNSNASESSADIVSGLSLFNGGTEWAYEFEITMNTGSRRLSRAANGGRHSLINGGFMQMLFSDAYSNGTQPFDLSWVESAGNSGPPASEKYADDLVRNVTHTVGFHKNPSNSGLIDIYTNGVLAFSRAADNSYQNSATDDLIRVKQNGSLEHFTATISFKGGPVSGTVPQIEIAGANTLGTDTESGTTQNTTGGTQIGSDVQVVGGGSATSNGTPFVHNFASPQSGVERIRIVQNVAGPFNFTEIEWYNNSNVNVALNQPADSSSFLALGGTNGGQALQAVDGIINVSCCGNMFHSNGGAGDWWEVNLAGPETISRLEFYGRNSNSSRNNDFDVQFFQGLTGGESLAQLIDVAEYVFEIQDTGNFDQLTVSRENAIFDRILDVNGASLRIKVADSSLLSPGDVFQILDVEQFLGSFEVIEVEVLLGDPIGFDTSNLLINGTISVQAAAAATPEPSTFALAMLSVASFGFLARRRCRYDTSC